MSFFCAFVFSYAKRARFVRGTRRGIERPLGLGLGLGLGFGERERKREIGDIVDAQSQRMLGFVEARHLLGIPPNYGFIWQQLHNIPLIQGSLPLHTGEQPWSDWCLKGQTSLL